MILRTMRWFLTADGEYPIAGGTKAVVYVGGDSAWMYWNVDAQTWHPLNGWRKNIGQPKTSVTAWAELPPPPK